MGLAKVPAQVVRPVVKGGGSTAEVAKVPAHKVPSSFLDLVDLLASGEAKVPALRVPPNLTMSEAAKAPVAEIPSMFAIFCRSAKAVL